MVDPHRLEELARLIDKYSNGEGAHETGIPGLRVIKLSTPVQMSAVYIPSICVIAQGSKQVLLENEIHHYAPSQFLATSVELPVIGQVLEASADKPYLCFQLDVNPREMSELMTQIEYKPSAGNGTERGMFVGKMDDTLMDCVLRLIRLLDTPKDIRLLAPLTIREMYYRLLSGEHGPAIIQLAMQGSTMQRIAQVIHKMKTDISTSIRIEDLAALANMSPSSFHYHFKLITAMSPLQYYKRLRLTEARQIMLTEQTDAASAAYRVGYESPSQFSREYARMFGAPPVRDIESVRTGRAA